MTIAFTGGGTGGHIYPGLAVAGELKKRVPDVRLIWLGSKSGMDRNIVESASIIIDEFFAIPSGKLRRYFSFRTIADFFKVVAGYFAAKKILKKQNASLLFSKGGFVSVPPCAAAGGLGIPVFTHESDYSPGLATKINARYALKTGGKIFTAYKDTARFFKEKYRSSVIAQGQPVRECFRSANAARGRQFLKVKDNARILLVLGGSQGAKEVNELIRAALPKLTELYTVVHQIGPGHEWDVEARENYKPFPYIKEEMPDVMASAQIIMGRSGAGIWEWAVCGKPMILIPLRGFGTRGDQVENAIFFEKAGAAITLKEGASSQDLANIVESLANNSEKRSAMTAASLKIGESNAALKIASFLAEELENRSKK